MGCCFLPGSGKGINGRLKVLPNAHDPRWLFPSTAPHNTLPITPGQDQAGKHADVGESTRRPQPADQEQILGSRRPDLPLGAQPPNPHLQGRQGHRHGGNVQTNAKTLPPSTSLVLPPCHPFGHQTPMLSKPGGQVRGRRGEHPTTTARNPQTRPCPAHIIPVLSGQVPAPPSPAPPSSSGGQPAPLVPYGAGFPPPLQNLQKARTLIRLPNASFRPATCVPLPDHSSQPQLSSKA